MMLADWYYRLTDWLDRNKPRVKCIKCDKNVAVYFYEGSRDRAYCNECVYRNFCGCNIDPNTNEEILDEDGRSLPCVDYSYYEKGLMP